MAHSLNRVTDSVFEDIYSQNDVEMTQEELNRVKFLNEVFKCRQLVKVLKESESKNALLNIQIRETEYSAVRNQSARNMIDIYLNNSSFLSKEVEVFLKSVVGVLEPGPNVFANNTGLRAPLQPPAVEMETSAGNVESSAADSFSRTTAPPVNLSTSALGMKRCQNPDKTDVPKQKRTCKSSKNISNMMLLNPLAEDPKNSFDKVQRTTNSFSPTRSAENEQPEIMFLDCPDAEPPVLATTNWNSASERASIRDDESSSENGIKGPGPSVADKKSIESNIQDIDEEFNEEAVVQQSALVLSKLSTKNSNCGGVTEIVEKLCKTLKCDSVALDLAIAYINEDLLLNQVLKDTIGNYLAKIEKVKQNQSHNLSQIVDNPVYLTWRVMSEKIKATPEKGEMALKVMYIISVLSPDNISTELLLKLFRAIENRDNLEIGENVFELLSRLSVIKYSLGNPISITPVVQEMIRWDMKELSKFTTVVDQILTGAQQMFEKNKIPSEEICHAESIWEHAAKITGLHQKYSNFPDWIASELRDLGKYQEMYAFSGRAIEILEPTLGEDNKWTLRMKFWSGQALENLGDYAKSLEILSAVYRKQMGMFLEEDSDCLDTAQGIGLAYSRLERYEEALIWFSDALEKRERMYGKEHPEALGLKNNMATVLNTQGKYKEAMRLHQEILEVREGMNGPEHPLTLTTKHNLAVTRLRQAQYKDALKMFQDVLEVRERILGVDHPSTLNNKQSIAVAYEHLGRKKEALEVWKEIWEKRGNILGSQHPQTVVAKNRVEKLNSKQ